MGWVKPRRLLKKNCLPHLLVNKSHVSASRLCIASTVQYSNLQMIHLCGVLENKHHSRLRPARLIYSVSTQQPVSTQRAIMVIMMMMMMMMAHWAETCCSVDTEYGVKNCNVH